MIHQNLPQEIFDVATKLGLLGPAVVYDGLTDVALDVGRQWAGAVVVLIVTLAGIDVNKMVLDGAFDTSRHVVVDGRETDGHADWLILGKLRTVLPLHLGIEQVHTGDIDTILGFVTGKNATETMLTKRTYLTEANKIVVCLFCEDLFAGLWGVFFLFHICVQGRTVNFDCKGNHFVGVVQIFSSEKLKITIHSYIFLVSY